MPTEDSKILAAFQEGTLRALIARDAYGDNEARRALEEALVRLHNKGAIDAMSVLDELSRETDRGPDFFRVQIVFEAVLPELNADVADVMNALVDIFKTPDIAATMLAGPFSHFCAATDRRPKEALALIENDPDRFAQLLPAVVSAGARRAHKIWFKKLLDLIGSENPLIVSYACFAVGSIDLKGDSLLADRTFAALEACANRTSDDRVLSNMVHAIFALRLGRDGLDKNAVVLLDRILSAGGNLTLHAAANATWHKGTEVDTDTLSLVLRHFDRVNPQYKSTIETLDRVLFNHLGEPGELEAIAFFERYCTANAAHIEPEAFEQFLRRLCSAHRDLFGRLIVKWFLSGEAALCSAVRWMVMKCLGESESLPVDIIAAEELGGFDRVFVTRKAIGYLFSRPKAVAEMILAMMEKADQECSRILEEYLFDPMLVNYPVALEPFLKKLSKTTSPKVKQRISGALKKWRIHIDGIKSVGQIKELAPSERERAVSHQHRTDQSTAIWREVEKNSVLLNLVSKSVILHGSVSVHYVREPDGEKRRHIIPMQTHSYSMDIPRQTVVNPFDLDYILCIFRAEQMHQ